MADPDLQAGPEPSGEPGSIYITADQLGIARLKQIADNEWQLTSVGPAIFRPTPIRAREKDGAIKDAKAWLATQIRNDPALFGLG